MPKIPGNNSTTLVSQNNEVFDPRNDPPSPFPAEVWTIIFQQLDEFSDISNFSHSTKAFNTISKDPKVWTESKAFLNLCENPKDNKALPQFLKLIVPKKKLPAINEKKRFISFVKSMATEFFNQANATYLLSFFDSSDQAGVFYGFLRRKQLTRNSLALPFKHEKYANIIKHLPLSQISVPWAPVIDAASLRQQIDKVIEKNPHIESFEFHDGLDDATLNAFLAKTPDLERLDLSRCANITPQGRVLLPTLTKLTTLDMGNHVTDAEMQGISGLSQLQKLSLKGDELTKNSMHEISKLQQLKELYWKNCPQDVDLPDLPLLKSLSLPGSDISGIKLAEWKNPSFLRVLDLSGCHHVGNEALPFIEKIGPHLQKLDVSFTEFQGAVFNAKTFPVLKELKISEAFFTAHQEVDLAFIHDLKQLTHLDTRLQEMVNDEFIEKLSTKTSLRSLCINYCTNITKKSLDIFKKMTWLEVLDFRNTTLISTSELRDLKAALPNTKIIYTFRR